MNGDSIKMFVEVYLNKVIIRYDHGCYLFANFQCFFDYYCSNESEFDFCDFELDLINRKFNPEEDFYD